MLATLQSVAILRHSTMVLVMRVPSSASGKRQQYVNWGNGRRKFLRHVAIAVVRVCAASQI